MSRDSYIRRYYSLFEKLKNFGKLPKGFQFVNPFELTEKDKGLIMYPISTSNIRHVNYFSWDGEKLTLHDPKEGKSVVLEDYYELSQWLNDNPRVPDILTDQKPLFKENNGCYTINE